MQQICNTCAVSPQFAHSGIIRLKFKSTNGAKEYSDARFRFLMNNFYPFRILSYGFRHFELYSILSRCVSSYLVGFTAIPSSAGDATYRLIRTKCLALALYVSAASTIGRAMDPSCRAIRQALYKGR